MEGESRIGQIVTSLFGPASSSAGPWSPSWRAFVSFILCRRVVGTLLGARHAVGITARRWTVDTMGGRRWAAVAGVIVTRRCCFMVVGQGNVIISGRVIIATAILADADLQGFLVLAAQLH